MLIPGDLYELKAFFKSNLATKWKSSLSWETSTYILSSGILISAPLGTPKTDSIGLICRRITSCDMDFHPFSNQTSYHIKTFFSNDMENSALKREPLKFSPGDILRVINSVDPDWWIACVVDDKTGSDISKPGLIPSVTRASKIIRLRRKKVRFDESSLVIQPPTPEGKKCGTFFKCFKFFAKAPKNDFQENCCEELIIPYIKVRKVDSEYNRPVIIFGAYNQKISHDLMRICPEKFRVPIPHTTRPSEPGEIEGIHFYFCGTEEFFDTKFIETGSFKKQKYGVSTGEVFKILRSKYICLMEISPISIMNLINNGIYPIVIFIRYPSYVDSTFPPEANGVFNKNAYEENVKFEKDHSHLFTEVIEDTNLSSIYDQVNHVIKKYSNKNIWISKSLY